MARREGGHPPEGWVNTLPFGEIVFRNFLPCKTPLAPGFLVPADKAWTPFHVRDAVADIGRQIDAVIDLTSANYYANEDWGDVMYRNIACATAEDRDEPPTGLAWHEFYLTVRYILDHRGPDATIVVHCKHGLNRTGYMICRWALTRGLADSPRDAIETFARLRPPGIYKGTFTADLHWLSGCPIPKRAPPPPPWRDPAAALPEIWRRLPRVPAVPYRRALHFSSDADEGTMVSHGRSTSDATTANITREILHHMSRACGVRTLNEFCGTHPVALSRHHLTRLREYIVTWKADGVRLIVIVLENGTFAVNRNDCIQEIPDLLCGLTYEQRSAIVPFVFDCELVVHDGNRHLWLHDTLMLRGVSLARPFKLRTKGSGRIAHLAHGSLAPRFIARDPKRGLVGRHAVAKHVFRALHFPGPSACLSVSLKGWWPAHQFERVMRDPENVPNDGLIFAHPHSLYRIGTDHAFLKWKEENSVDFYVDTDFNLMLKDHSHPNCNILINKDKAFRDRIIEAVYNRSIGGWMGKRIRRDKKRANARSTYESNMKVIENPVEVQDLELALAPVQSTGDHTSTIA